MAMTATFDDVYTQIGKPEEFHKQIKINKELSVSLSGPVYQSWRPSEKPPASSKLKRISTFDLLQKIIPIVGAYMVVTVRQVYYVLVSRQDIFNNLNEYRRIIRILTNARLAGFISFESIIDDTRQAEKTPSWSSIEDILKAAINQYRSDWWKGQEYYIEVWLEKRALKRVFYPTTNGYDVHLCTGGGYQSWSELYQASKRFRAKKDRKCVLLYFGDLDPSGKDMPRDIKDRLAKLCLDVSVVEVALTKKDITEYRLPKNPSKKKDSRKNYYLEKYGIDYAVELDALPPDILANKIKNSIEAFCDIELLNKKVNEDRIRKKFWEKRLEDFRADE